MANKDYTLISSCIEENKKGNLFSSEGKDKVEYPLDNEIINLLGNIMEFMKDSKNDYEIFKHPDLLNQLWKSLIEKAIKCLRYFDKREPFMKIQEKKPSAYGVDKLYDYYTSYTEYERILYGSSKNYRDHIVHVFRTWLSGVDCLLRNNGKYLNSIKINEEEMEINNCEKLSIWTIVALTHDLGYPLEKAKGIIETTKKMVSTFIANPDISMDLTFHGVQNYMNDFIVRLMSSKMIVHDTYKQSNPQKPYVARLQPKYYFKFQKSLEKNEHGIISTLIIYKLLTYFLESDYNINEDYSFSKEECRQFYIRREILRSIASHTCKDVYHLFMSSFAFLLIMSDDTQEWGRKYLSELYVESGNEYELLDLQLTVFENKSNKCEIREKFTIQDRNDVNSIKNLLLKLHKQALSYIMMFRDGQETDLRNFSFTKYFNVICNITYENNDAIIIFDLILDINNDKQSSFGGRIKYANENDINKKFSEEFFKSLFLNPEEKKLVSWVLEDKNNNDPKKWKSGKINFPLVY
jgi:hypothetical protein